MCTVAVAVAVADRAVGVADRAVAVADRAVAVADRAVAAAVISRSIPRVRVLQHLPDLVHDLLVL